MKQTTNDVTGIIFDYGGTIDTNGRHWASVLWEKYAASGVPVSNEEFRSAYVYAERALAAHPYIKPDFTFHDMLKVKVKLQLAYLHDGNLLQVKEETRQRYAAVVADSCYEFVLETLRHTRPVLEELSHKYPLVLVSNFYGNIQAVLDDFSLSSFFQKIVESAVVGVRKPDPAIYQLGVDALRMPASKVLVVGDSYGKDVLPAKAVGCKVAWLKGETWKPESADEHVPDMIIADLAQLPGKLGA